MAAYKCNRSHRKKLNSELVKAVSSLRKENILLKKTLADVSDHHREHNKLVEVNAQLNKRCLNVIAKNACLLQVLGYIFLYFNGDIFVSKPLFLVGVLTETPRS